MAVPSVLNEESLYRFLEEHGNNRAKMGLLTFWSMAQERGQETSKTGSGIYEALVHFAS